MARVTNPDGSVTVDLKHPVTGPDGELKQITLKRLKGKQFRAVNISEIDNGHHLLNLIGTLSTLPPPITDQLDAEDIIKELRPVVMDFFGLSRATGDS